MSETQIISKAKVKLIQLKSMLKSISLGQKISKKYEWMCLIDIIDYINYYTHIKNKEYRNAFDIQENMDTCPRDEIPIYFFDFVRNNV